MGKINKIRIVSIILVISAVFSCNSDDADTISADAILGEWLTLRRETKSGVAGELSFCESRIFLDFQADGNMIAKWTTEDAPPECSDLSLSSLKWENVGNNRWEVGTEVLLLSIIRLEGGVMVQENQDNEWVYFYEKR